MNKSSLLCKLISENPDTWRDICINKQIKFKEDGDLAIFNYDIKADFYDPIVKEARGIIIDTNKCEVVCWPFNKFFNSHESYADPIDWSTAKVQEKVDGSIVKMWFDKSIGTWRWSSNSCIDANEAKTASGKTLMQIIKMTHEYKMMQSSIVYQTNLYEGATYIFELVSPYNAIVIKYDKPMLYHIGTRSNDDGFESSYKLPGFPVPKMYELNTMDDCINAAKELNKNSDYPTNEGFVVVDAAYRRIKIKAPEYLVYHHAISNITITKESAWDLIHVDDFNLDTFLESAPEHIAEDVKWYIKEFNKAKLHIAAICKIACEMASNGCTRKEIAEKVKSDRYSFYAFKVIENPNLDINELIEKYHAKYFLKGIKDKAS